MILWCAGDCRHEYQDKLYGLGKRVHVPKKNARPHEETWQCTVCLTMQDRKA